MFIFLCFGQIHKILLKKTFQNKSMCSYCKMKADLTRFNNRVKWSYLVHTYRIGEGKGHTVHCKIVFQKNNLCICSGALWLVANVIRYFCKICGGWP